MRLKIVVCVCVDDDDRDGAMRTAPNRNPLDELIARMRREMQRGRDSAGERTVHGAKVAG
ncbi:MAG: hypothetical protein GXX96_31345 [Planctomycetaceae bacterium]|nr:hypothetical protein [Planctomycetaceae bacterium]